MLFRCHPRKHLYMLYKEASLTSVAKTIATKETTLPTAGAADIADMRSDRMEDRYALALIELAETHNATDAIAADVTSLRAALSDSAALRRLLSNPILPRDAQGRALTAIAAKLGVNKLTQNFLRLIARKGRQGALSAILSAFQTELARRSGAISADVTSAAPLSEMEQQALIAAVTKAAARHGSAPKSVTLNVTVDPSLLGGLKVRIGSRLYDRSLSGQLDRLQQTLEQAA